GIDLECMRKLLSTRSWRGGWGGGALASLQGVTERIPCVVGGKEVWTNDIRYQLCPFNHSHKVAKFCYADKGLLNEAISAALAARAEWDLRPLEDRAEIFFKAADLLSGPKHAEILAKTMIGQGKTVMQAEIDAAAELIDFFRFNAKYALDLKHQQPLSVAPSTNTLIYRGLEGFVAAISPFNFTAIGGNLAGTPALMVRENYVNSQTDCMLSSHELEECAADCLSLNDQLLPTKKGSVTTFKRLWKQVAQNIDNYHVFPRLAGECGGKNYHFVHASADVRSVVTGTLRSAFEYGGQKCSACSRMYVPDSLWPQIQQGLLQELPHLQPGDVSQKFCFAERSQYGTFKMTTVVEEASRLLRNSSGNFYINDKSTGSVVAQQPFGGARASGTNDKPGSPMYVTRWTSAQAVKETSVPLTEWKYPYMA
uniref:Aldehyde dehydrogenase 4 family, member A1 n=1 Tax=Eptatretus burgeri TaxID=7764 RepID=A0A8C4QE35_EPTBU